MDVGNGCVTGRAAMFAEVSAGGSQVQEFDCVQERVSAWSAHEKTRFGWRQSEAGIR